MGLIQRLKRSISAKRRNLGVAKPDSEQGPGFYDSIYATSESFQGHYSRSHYYFLWCVIADRLRRAGITSMLEVGCGPGQLAAMLLELDIVREYRGFDFSPTGIEMAGRAAPSGRFWLGDARDPANYAERCDAIVCTEVLEHVDADLQIAEAFPRGTLCICSVPSFPYVSHVRHFASADAVRERYGRYFREFDVGRFRSPRDLNDWFYLMQGVRI